MKLTFAPVYILTRMTLNVGCHVVAVAVLCRVYGVLGIFHGHGQLHGMLQSFVLQSRRRIIGRWSLILGCYHRRPDRLHLIVLGVLLLRLISLASAKHQQQSDEQYEHYERHYDGYQSRRRYD